MSLSENLAFSPESFSGRVRLFEDEYGKAASDERPELQRRLLEAFKRVLPQIPEAHEQLDELLGNQVPLGMLTDIVAYTLDIDLEFKERLLAETNVDRRAE